MSGMKVHIILKGDSKLEFDFMKGLIPPELLQLSIFMAATSGFFFFGWNKIIMPIFTKLYQTRFHQIEFHSSEEIYHKAQLWLFKNKKHCRFSRNHKAIPINDEDEDTENFILIPGYGSFVLWKRKTPLILISRSKQDKEGVFQLVESMTFSIFTSNLDRITDLFKEINSCTIDNPSKNIRAYMHGYWHTIGLRKHIPYLISHKTREVYNDIRHFLSSEQKELYQKKNIPYRRGYILHGPPGTGKSNLISYVSEKLTIPIHTITSDVSFSDMLDMFRVLNKEMKIFLIEDIDMSQYGHKRLSNGKKSNQTGDSSSREEDKKEGSVFRLFLNLLDGIARYENFIFICTTNKIEKLDKALLRPGRIDKVVGLKYLSAAEQMEYFNRYYECDKSIKVFQELPKRSIADITCIFSEYPLDPDHTLKELASRKIK